VYDAELARKEKLKEQRKLKNQQRVKSIEKIVKVSTDSADHPISPQRKISIEVQPDFPTLETKYGETSNTKSIESSV